MNYILFYHGEIPKYIEYTLNSILSSDKNAKIYFCTNQKFHGKNITNVDFNEFTFLKEKKFEIDTLLHNTALENNPLWSTSIMRIYVLKIISEELNINKFIHFDTDIILYKSFQNIQKNYNFNNTKLNITLLDYENLVFGYSYFPGLHIINNIYESFENIFNNYDFYSKKYTKKGGFLNEMKMMNITKEKFPENFSLLPSTPYKDTTILFDPAGYGQYLDGAHVNRGNYYFKRRYISLTSEVGRELMSKRINLQFKNNYPVVIHNSKKFELCNLHIHSKRLHKFLPKNYQSFI